jgi:hypothetical protein
MSEHTRALLEEIRNLLEPIQDRSGAVLYSGTATLTRGDLYVMGDNPGGESDSHNADASKIANSLHPEGANWHEYIDGQWGKGPFQTRAKMLFDAIGTDLRTTLATNTVFVRSATSAELADGWRLWWDHCWKVHQILLHVVQPRIVICFGRQAFQKLRHTEEGRPGKPIANPTLPRKERFRAAELFDNVSFDLGAGHGRHVCSVLAHPHPSSRGRFGWNDETREVWAKVRGRLNPSRAGGV